MFTSNRIKALIIIAAIAAGVLAHVMIPTARRVGTYSETFTADNIVANTSIKDNGLTSSTLVSNDGSKVLQSYTGSGCGVGSAISALSAAGGATCIATGTGTVTSTGSAGYIAHLSTATNIDNWSGSGCGSGSALQTISGSGSVTCVAAGGTSSGGLFNGTMTAIPTQSALGFSSWNTFAGAAFTDIDQGIEMTWTGPGATPSVPGISAVAPATPYTLTATLTYSYTCGANTGNLGCVGWAQGTSGTTGSTKMEALCYVPCGSGGFQQRIIDATSATGGSFTVSQSAAYIRSSGAGIPWFVRLKDDGTTVTFQISFDGIGFTTVYSVAKASGFLGAGGYSRLFFGNWDFNNGPAYVTLLGWKTTSP